MKRLSVLLFLLIFTLCSCGEQKSPTALLVDFVYAYGAEGFIYSTEYSEGEEGYITPELERAIFGQSDINATYAVFLNIHPDQPSECGAFLIEGNRNELIELAKRRMELLDPSGERAFMVIYGDILFYSTLSDRAVAEKLAGLVFGR